MDKKLQLGMYNTERMAMAKENAVLQQGQDRILTETIRGQVNIKKGEQQAAAKKATTAKK